MNEKKVLKMIGAYVFLGGLILLFTSFWVTGWPLSIKLFLSSIGCLVIGMALFEERGEKI